MTMSAALYACATRIRDHVAGVTPAGVWAIAAPADVDAVSMATFPVVIVKFSTTFDQTWGRISFGRGLHRWGISIFVYLGRGFPDNERAEAAADAAVFAWPEALATCLYADMDLGGTVKRIGYGQDVGELFPEIRIGSLLWEGKADYHGIRFTMPVEQVYAQTMQA